MSGKWAHRDVSDDESEEEEEQQLPVPPPKSISPAPPAVTAPPAPAASLSEPVYQDARARGSGLSGFVSGIKFSANEDDFANFLESANCHVTHIRFQTDRESHRFNGKAVIQLADEESMQAFLSLDGTQYLGMSLRTKPNEQRQYGGDREFTRGGGRGGRGRGGDQGRGDYREQRDSGRGPQRDRRGGRGDRVPREEDVAEEEGPKERPKLNLKPRTVPVNPENRTDRSSAIFGGGRPHDDQEYEERKKNLVATAPESQAPSTAEVAAPTPAASAPVEVSEAPAAAAEGQSEEFTTVQRKGRGGQAGNAKRVTNKDSAPNKDKDAAGSGRHFQNAIGSIQRGSGAREKEGGNKGPGDKKDRSKEKKPRREKAKAENVGEVKISITHRLASCCEWICDVETYLLLLMASSSRHDDYLTTKIAEILHCNEYCCYVYTELMMPKHICYS